MCQPTKYYRSLEVEVKNPNTNAFPFNQDEVLGKASKITAIEAYPPTTTAVAPSGAPAVSAAVFNKATVSLQTKDDQNPITDLPLQRLNPAANNGVKYMIDTMPLNVTKCFIKVGDTTGLVAGQVFVLGITYEK